MTLLPNAGLAILDVRKIRDYCLDPAHSRGRHKARVFRRALDIGRKDADWLRDVLVAGLRDSDATELGTDPFGARWQVDVTVTRLRKICVIRTLWIMRTGETVPRFVTCWVL